MGRTRHREREKVKGGDAKLEVFKLRRQWWLWLSLQPYTQGTSTSDMFEGMRAEKTNGYKSYANTLLSNAVSIKTLYRAQKGTWSIDQCLSVSCFTSLFCVLTESRTIVKCKISFIKLQLSIIQFHIFIILKYQYIVYISLLTASSQHSVSLCSTLIY